MKHLFILLSIFTVSIICEPVVATQLDNQTTTELVHIQKDKYKTNKKRRARTCLKKSGCKKHKTISLKKKKCNTY